MNWTKFCTEEGIPHNDFDHVKNCPHCGARNPSYKPISKASQEVIEIEDSPQPKALTISKQSVRRFESYKQRPIAELVRQTSAQNLRNSTSIQSQKNRSQNKLETFRTNVTLWRRRYRTLKEEEIRTDIQTECYQLRKTTIFLKNVNVTNLNEFLYEHLLREIQVWKDLVRTQGQPSESSVYLATSVGKDGPTVLPSSANELQTIKDILKFFSTSSNNKEWMIHIILDQEEIRTDDDETLSLIKSEPKVKKETKDRTKIKKEKIKKEESKEPKRLKRERPISSEAHTPTPIRLRFPVLRTSSNRTDVVGMDAVGTDVVDTDIDDLDTELEDESEKFPDVDSILTAQEESAPPATRTRQRVGKKTDSE